MIKLIIIEDKGTRDSILADQMATQFLSDDTIRIFDDEWEALDCILENEEIEGVIVNVDLKCCDSLRLVRVIETINPDFGFVFISTSGRYDGEASNFNVVDYLKKPYTTKMLTQSINKLAARKTIKQEHKIYIKTFGSFEIYVDDKLIPWGNSKPKELFAFLVDAGGASVSSLKIQQTLWPESDIKKAASTFHTTLHSLRKTLTNLEIEEILETSRGSQRINTEIFQCDFYEFEKYLQVGTKDSLGKAFDLYRGHYLENNCFDWSYFNRIRLKTKFEEISNIL